jgi:hypothetical protein
MKRWWLAGFLACGALLWSVITAAAQGPIRSETRYAGAYTLRIDLYADPAFVGRRYTFDVLVSATTPADLRRLAVTAWAIPDRGTNATAVHASLTPAGSAPGGFQGYVTMSVRGSWLLRFDVAGPAGSSSVDLLLHVAAPTAIPIWLAWSIGLAPLVGLIGFAAGQRSYLSRLQRGASPALPTASTPTVS